MSRYFIGIVPEDPLQEEIRDIKKYFASHYNSKSALRSPGHITLHMPFDMTGPKEERFLLDFERYSSALSAFQIELEGFGAFAPRVIFISVKHCETLCLLQKEMVEFMKRDYNIFNQAEDLRAFHPHVTVAFRDLKKPIFHEAWKEFMEKPFKAEFTCRSVSLLRLDESTGWHEERRIELKAPG